MYLLIGKKTFERETLNVKLETQVCDAILFDFDGVIIDSEPVYERHWREWANEHNASYEHIISIHHGIPAVRTISIVAPHVDAAYEADQFQYRCIEDLEGLAAYGGIAHVLNGLPANRWAIATSSYRQMVKNQLSYLTLPQPQVLVTVEDVKHGKPSPEPYLKAAEALDVDPASCIVIEDSPAGIDAGRAAGAFVIGVASTKPASALANANWIVDRFADLKITWDGEMVQVSRPTV